MFGVWKLLLFKDILITYLCPANQDSDLHNFTLITQFQTTNSCLQLFLNINLAWRSRAVRAARPGGCERVRGHLRGGGTSSTASLGAPAQLPANNTSWYYTFNFTKSLNNPKTTFTWFLLFITAAQKIMSSLRRNSEISYTYKWKHSHCLQDFRNGD